MLLRVQGVAAPSPFSPDLEEALCGEAVRDALRRRLVGRVLRLHVARHEVGGYVGDAVVAGDLLSSFLLAREMAVPHDVAAGPRPFLREELRRATAAAQLLLAR